jgi:hypothetical protein
VQIERRFEAGRVRLTRRTVTREECFDRSDALDERPFGVGLERGPCAAPSAPSCAAPANHALELCDRPVGPVLGGAECVELGQGVLDVGRERAQGVLEGGELGLEDAERRQDGHGRAVEHVGGLVHGGESPLASEVRHTQHGQRPATGTLCRRRGVPRARRHRRGRVWHRLVSPLSECDPR